MEGEGVREAPVEVMVRCGKGRGEGEGRVSHDREPPGVGQAISGIPYCGAQPPLDS